MESRRLISLLTICLLAASAVPMLAQTGFGTVTGTVKDATGAVIPGAAVTLTNTGTGAAAKSETNNVGVYYFGSVRPGPYTLVIEAKGFKKWSGTLQLEVGQNASVDPNMEVGTLEATSLKSPAPRRSLPRKAPRSATSKTPSASINCRSTAARSPTCSTSRRASRAAATRASTA